MSLPQNNLDDLKRRVQAGPTICHAGLLSDEGQPKVHIERCYSSHHKRTFSSRVLDSSRLLDRLVRRPPIVRPFVLYLY